jgi:hypothetical protein
MCLLSTASHLGFVPLDFVQWLAITKLLEDEGEMDEKPLGFAQLVFIIKILHEFLHEDTFSFPYSIWPIRLDKLCATRTHRIGAFVLPEA